MTIMTLCRLPGVAASFAVAMFSGALVFGNAAPSNAQLLTQQSLSTPFEHSSSAFAIDSSYTLGTGDTVFVEIFNVADYSREYDVLADGTIGLPLIGSVNVRGMTLNEAAEAISTRYAYYLRRPIVSLELRQTRPIQIAIAGEVNRPGSYTLLADASDTTSASDRSLPTVTKAIQLAGGITQSADIRSIRVRRLQVQGGEQMSAIEISLWELIQSGDLSQDLRLRDGDSIVVPKASTLNASESLTLASASFSPDTIRVNVVGEVVRPGTLELPPNTPLNQAILASGGFNTRAARGSVTLVRLNVDGTVTQREIDTDFEQGISDDTNPTLRSGDTVLVGRSGLASFTDTLGSVLSPINGVFSLFRLLGLD
jgi:polysaccharide biosynthesis/export protein